MKKPLGKFIKGDKVKYDGIEATVLDVNTDDYPRVWPTYKIEVKTTCVQRFWVTENKLTPIL